MALIGLAVLSGTLTKFATTGSAIALARVAKWGVVIEADYSAISSIDGVSIDEKYKDEIPSTKGVI